MRYRDLDLDPFQSNAIAALEAGDSVLVCAPTGTGKTVVADWMVEKALAAGRHVVYTAPVKALSNQKFRDYCALFGEENVGLVTGDLVIRRDAPCRVMTTEILRNILLVGEDLPDLAGVIVDEIHYLDDRERGTTWEEVLLYLPRDVQILGLSATLSNLEEFSAWLESVRERKVQVIEEQKRAVPLSFQVATRLGGLRDPDDMGRYYTSWARKNAWALKKMEQSRGRSRGRRRGPTESLSPPTRHTDLFQMLYPEALPYLYFVFSRRQAEGFARQLTWKLPEDGLLDDDEHRAVSAAIAAFRSDEAGAAALDPELEKLYLQGVAFHHAGLHVGLKALVEELYERKLIKVLYCTGTFALGINMPARTAVFEGLERFDGHGMIPLPTREFMQMAGRAGRRGMDESGLVVVRADLETYSELGKWLDQHLKGRYEPVRSSFSLSFNSVVNLMERHTPTQIRRLVERSFLAFHRARQATQRSREAERLERELNRRGWTEGEPPPAQIKTQVKHLRRLQRDAAEGAGRTWEEYEAKVHFLKDIGYLAEDDSFNAGARVLRHVQIQEIFTTELFLSGVLEELPMPVLFGVLCGMCNELPKSVAVDQIRQYKGLIREVEGVARSDVVFGAAQLTRAPLVWDARMIPFGRWWAEGRSLNELLINVSSHTDVSGELVGAFRRARELGGQLKAVWADIDPGRASEVAALVRSVSRDEVEVVD